MKLYRKYTIFYDCMVYSCFNPKKRSNIESPSAINIKTKDILKIISKNTSLTILNHLPRNKPLPKFPVCDKKLELCTDCENQCSSLKIFIIQGI